jgi:hypothetical protein
VLSIYSAPANETSNWKLINQFSIYIEDLSTLKVLLCGRKLGFIYFNNGINYNFFDLNYRAWSFESFQTISNSNCGMLVDLSVASYFSAPLNKLNIATITSQSGSSTLSYYTVTDMGIETKVNLETTNLTTLLSSQLVQSGYKACGIVSTSSGDVKIFVTGATTAVFERIEGEWGKTLVDMESGCGLKPSKLVIGYDSISEFLRIAFNSQNSIFYYEQTEVVGFNTAEITLAILNAKRLYLADWVDGAFDGSEVNCVYHTTIGSLLKDGTNPVGIFDSLPDIRCMPISNGCPTTITALMNTTVRDGINFIFDKYLQINFNGVISDGHYLLLYSGATDGQDFDTNSIFWGNLLDGSAGTFFESGYITLSINGSTYYTPFYNYVSGSNVCCSNVSGQIISASGSNFTLAGYSLILVNNNLLRYVPVYEI